MKFLYTKTLPIVVFSLLGGLQPAWGMDLFDKISTSWNLLINKNDSTSKSTPAPAPSQTSAPEPTTTQVNTNQSPTKVEHDSTPTTTPTSASTPTTNPAPVAATSSEPVRVNVSSSPQRSFSTYDRFLGFGFGAMATLGVASLYATYRSGSIPLQQAVTTVLKNFVFPWTPVILGVIGLSFVKFNINLQVHITHSVQPELQQSITQLASMAPAANTTLAAIAGSAQTGTLLPNNVTLNLAGTNVSLFK